MQHHKHLILKGDMQEAYSVKFIENWLNKIVDKIGMKLVKGMPVNPCVGFEADTENNGEDNGVTGVAIITTSHIILHTWDKTLQFQFDLYSCKDFDSRQIIKELKKIGLIAKSKTLLDRNKTITTIYE